MKKRSAPLQTSDSPTFGQLLRALRFRFNWSRKHGCFVRLRDGGSIVTVQLHPAGLIPNCFGGKNESYFIWWNEKQDSPLNYIPAIQNIRGVKKAIQFNVDAETGERV